MNRPDGRTIPDLRPISFIPNIAPHASGSVLVSFGNTRVICAATVEENVPRWMKFQNVEGGWVSAEYSMLPYSTHDRKQRDINRGKLDGRSSEIQRLIGRSLRAVIDLKKLGKRTIWIDCDVLQADGGTRTASITGGCVAAAIAINGLMSQGKLNDFPLKKLVAAVSAGIYKGEAILDLNYPESGEYVELQGSGEEDVFTSEQMTAMLDLARDGVTRLIELQKEAIIAADKATGADLEGLAAAFR